MELPAEGQGVIEAARRLFAGRDGRIALTLVLAVTATLEASIYTPHPGNLALAILVNVLAVLPLLASRRFPLLAAVATTCWTVVLLVATDAPLTVTGLGVLLYLVGNLVVRRSLVWGLPFLAPFLLNAMAPFGGGDAGPGSVAPSSSSRQRSSSASRRESDRWRRPSSTPPRRRWRRACKSRLRWRSERASRASCTTSSPTISR
jgi:hypothetical protein